MRKADYTLYLVTDSALAGGRPIEQIVVEAVRGGVTIVQLREKDLATRPFLEKAFALKQALQEPGVPLIINDRLDIALACGAAGVHLGQDDMPCRLARKIAGSGFIIGVSVSTVEEAREAEGQGADYVAVSPVFATPTKTDTPTPAGLQILWSIRREVRCPLVGIGGINLANVASVIESGADGIAVVSAIMGSPDPFSAAQALRTAIEHRISPGD